MFKDDSIGLGTATGNGQASDAFRLVHPSQDVLAAMIDSSDDAILSVDLEGRITSWNRATQRLYGFPAVDVLGKPLTRLTLPQALQGVVQTIEAIRYRQQGQASEAIRVHNDGQPLDLAVVVSPIQNAGAAFLGFRPSHVI